uniref:Uncharacterized protein n=1 Tax=Arundo donax TaxID=35708 RepID=A0A0A8ZMQ6_ARUDO
MILSTYSFLKLPTVPLRACLVELVPLAFG